MSSSPSFEPKNQKERNQTCTSPYTSEQTLSPFALSAILRRLDSSEKRNHPTINGAELEKQEDKSLYF
jgi:hypothetical protein